MKVLLVGQTYYRKDNGQAVFTINLAEGLAAAGHQIVVLAPSTISKPERKQVHGVRVQTTPALPLIYNTNITAFSGRWVERTFSSFQPDVVHLQDHYFLSQSVLAMAQAQGLQAVGTNHFLPENLSGNVPFSHWFHKPLDQLLWASMLSVYNRLRAVSTPSETAAAILREQGIHAPVTAISNGVDVERFRPRPTLDPSTLRKRYGLAQDKSIVAYVGRLDHEKNLDLLIHAFARLDRTDVQLAICGKGGSRSELEKLGRTLALGDRIAFTGFVADSDLPLLLNSIDLFAMPSHAELQSIATLEAMASGLPILAANARALPELVDQGSNGQLFAANNVADAARALERLLEQQPDWPTMGAASRHKAEGHAHEKVVGQYLDWYEQAVAIDKQAIW